MTTLAIALLLVGYVASFFIGGGVTAWLLGKSNKRTEALRAACRDLRFEFQERRAADHPCTDCKHLDPFLAHQDCLGWCRCVVASRDYGNKSCLPVPLHIHWCMWQPTMWEKRKVVTPVPNEPEPKTVNDEETM